MIHLYILSLVLGAVLLVAALFSSGSRIEADEPPQSRDETTPPNQIGQLEGVGGGEFLGRTVRSGRFWTFFVPFFGMTGLVLDGLDVMAPAVAFLVAVAVGAIGGAGGAAVVRIGSS